MDILICEDNALVAMDLEWSLKELGHTVLGVVATARDCRARVEAQPPDLVMVDLNLADGRTGLALVEDLAAKGIASIVVSGEAHLVGPGTSARAVLAKPFRDAELAQALTEVERRS